VLRLGAVAISGMHAKGNVKNAKPQSAFSRTQVKSPKAV
jgi:hypothetical protein